MTAIPYALRQRTFAERKAAADAFERRHPKHPLAGLVSLGIEEIMTEDKRGRPAGMMAVETFVDRHTWQVAARRYGENGVIELVERPATPPPAAIGYGLLRRRRREPAG